MSRTNCAQLTDFEIADAAIHAEHRTAEALSALPEVEACVQEAVEDGNRASARAALDELLDEVDDDAAEAKQAQKWWDESCRLNWALALRAMETARHESRRRHVQRALEPEDLEQEAAVGLYKAACRFEPGRGRAFSTYARWWVRASLNDAVQHGTSAVRVPDSATRDIRKLLEARKVLRREKADAGFADAAEDAGVRLERARALEGLARVESLDDAIEAGEGRKKDRLTSPDDVFQTVCGRFLSRQMRQMLRERLSAREQVVVAHRFGLDGRDPMTFGELGEELGVSGERARQIFHKALERLGQHLEPEDWV